MATAKRKRRPAAKKSVAPRRRRTMSAARPKRRRRSTRKRGLLSAMGAQVTAFANTAASGAVGGGIYRLYETKVDTTTWTPEKKGFVAVLGAYAIDNFMGKPKIAAGVVATAFYDYAKTTGLLGDEGEQMQRQKWADPLQNIPIMMSDEEMLLAARGNDGMDLRDQMDLREGNYMPGYASSKYA